MHTVRKSALMPVQITPAQPSDAPTAPTQPATMSFNSGSEEHNLTRNFWEEDITKTTVVLMVLASALWVRRPSFAFARACSSDRAAARPLPFPRLSEAGSTRVAAASAWALPNEGKAWQSSCWAS